MLWLVTTFLLLGCGRADSPTAPDVTMQEAFAGYVLDGHYRVYDIRWEFTATEYDMRQTVEGVGLVYWEVGQWWIGEVDGGTALIRTVREGGRLLSDDTWEGIHVATYVQFVQVLSPGGYDEAHAVMMASPGGATITYQVLAAPQEE